ncbi:hypothetical protein L204_101475 [Cryptococcus depauperatus]|nr:hypothetical protein L204_04148 [Cryptococcus depauperatus CBS 7855]
MAGICNAWLVAAFTKHDNSFGADYKQPIRGGRCQVIEFQNTRTPENPDIEIDACIGDKTHTARVRFAREAIDLFERPAPDLFKSLTGYLRAVFSIDEFYIHLVPPKCSGDLPEILLYVTSFYLIEGDKNNPVFNENSVQIGKVENIQAIIRKWWFGMSDFSHDHSSLDKNRAIRSMPYFRPYELNEDINKDKSEYEYTAEKLKDIFKGLYNEEKSLQWNVEHPNLNDVYVPYAEEPRENPSEIHAPYYLQTPYNAVLPQSPSPLVRQPPQKSKVPLQHSSSLSLSQRTESLSDTDDNDISDYERERRRKAKARVMANSAEGPKSEGSCSPPSSSSLPFPAALEAMGLLKNKEQTFDGIESSASSSHDSTPYIESRCSNDKSLRDKWSNKLVMRALPVTHKNIRDDDEEDEETGEKNGVCLRPNFKRMSSTPQTELSDHGGEDQVDLVNSTVRNNQALSVSCSITPRSSTNKRNTPNSSTDIATPLANATTKEALTPRPKRSSSSDIKANGKNTRVSKNVRRAARKTAKMEFDQYDALGGQEESTEEPENERVKIEVIDKETEREREQEEPRKEKTEREGVEIERLKQEELNLTDCKREEISTGNKNASEKYRQWKTEANLDGKNGQNGNEDVISHRTSDLSFNYQEEGDYAPHRQPFASTSSYPSLSPTRYHSCSSSVLPMENQYLHIPPPKLGGLKVDLTLRGGGLSERYVLERLMWATEKRESMKTASKNKRAKLS